MSRSDARRQAPSDDFVGAKLPLYVVFGDESGAWRIQAVPIAPGSFTSRRALPRAWCGLRDAALDAAAGVRGATFVHINGFTGGAASLDCVMELAKRAVESQQQQ